MREKLTFPIHVPQMFQIGIKVSQISVKMRNLAGSTRVCVCVDAGRDVQGGKGRGGGRGEGTLNPASHHRKNCLMGAVLRQD